MERWLRNRVPPTQKKYLGYMGRFQLLAGLSPEQLLQWCRTVESVEVQDLIDRTSMEFKPAIQFCYRVALRSFLRHNGYNSLPRADLQYVSQAWHRGYRRSEIQALLGHLGQRVHRLFVVMAAESGLRSHVLVELRYRHLTEDLESRTIPVAVRLEPRFHVGKKAAGYTFLGAGSVRLLKECIEEGHFEARPDDRLIQRSYYGVWAAVHRAKNRAGLDHKIQSCHGFRKYFESALDEAAIDHEKKMIIEGHIAGTRAKYYTDRDIDQLREVYRKAYPYIVLEARDHAKTDVRPEIWQKDLKRVDQQLAHLSSRVTVLTELLKLSRQPLLIPSGGATLSRSLTITQQNIKELGELPPES